MQAVPEFSSRISSTMVAALLRGAWAPVGISSSSSSSSSSSDLRDLASPRVNIVHMQRPDYRAPPGNPAQLFARQQQRVTIDAARPEAALEQLLDGLAHPALQQAVAQDVLLGAAQLSALLQRDHLHAKLQLISRQSCPNWHADTVGCRLLVTYAGPGTWFVDDRHVTRQRDWWSRDVSVAAVDESHACQAAAGDLLFLKGHHSPGMAGAGAVHRSPEVGGHADVRLLLTLDDSGCGC